MTVVSQSTDYLFCEDPASGSKKVQKALSWGVQVISYDDLLEKLRIDVAGKKVCCTGRTFWYNRNELKKFLEDAGATVSAAQLIACWHTLPSIVAPGSWGPNMFGSPVGERTGRGSRHTNLLSLPACCHPKAKP